WVDVKVLTVLLRNRKATRFMLPDGTRTIDVFYPPSLMRRMRALACAVGGRLTDVDCAAIRAPLELDDDLHRLAEHAGADRAQPGRDAMVRDWYRASAAWMQHVESHDTQHIDRGREIFSTDPDILFLSGALHETYARPAIQSAAHAAVVPTGFSIDILSAR